MPRIPGCANWPGLRLAAVMLDEKAYDEATKQLAAEPTPSHLRRASPNCGDVFAAQGKIAEARNAYDNALEKFDALAKDDEDMRQRGG